MFVRAKVRSGKGSYWVRFVCIKFVKEKARKRKKTHNEVRKGEDARGKWLVCKGKGSYATVLQNRRLYI